MGKKKLEAVVAESFQLSEQVKLVQVLHSIGLNDKQISKLVMLMQPMLVELISTEMNNVFSQGDVMNVELKADSQSLNEGEKEQVYLEFYKIKTGKSITELVKTYFDEIADKIKKADEDLKQILDTIVALPEAAQEQKMEELLAEKINNYLPQNN